MIKILNVVVGLSPTKRDTEEVELNKIIDQEKIIEKIL